MVLYMASGAEFEKMMKNSTPEQQKKGMEAWMKWMNANKTSLVEGVAPLRKTKRVDQSGASNTKKTRSAGLRLCRPNRMMRRPRYSASPSADAWRMDRNN
jgi:hypothetical protein